MRDVAHAIITRDNAAVLNTILGAHVGKPVDAATARTIAQRLNSELGAGKVTAQDIPALVRSFAASSRALDDRRSTWNPKGALALQIARVSQESFETAVSSVMRRVSAARDGVAAFARASLATTGKVASMGVAAGMLATTLAAGVPAAAYAQELGATVQTSTRAMQVNSIDDVARRFRVDQHVYAVGDANGPVLGSLGLDRLEQYISSHPEARNFTFVAIERADRSDAELRRITGQIGDLPAFQGRVDPRTGQTNGVLVVVAFGSQDSATRRSITLRVGDLFRTRGLTDTASIREPFNRGGKNATLYVRATDVINFMNQSVDATVQQEQTRATQAVSGARADLDRADGRVRDVETRLAAFTRAHRVDGDIARPQIGQWRSQLSAVRGGVRDNAPRDALTRAQGVATDVINASERALRAMTEYESAPRIIAEVQTTIDKAAGSSHAGQASTQLAAARDQLARARSAHGVGNSSYEASLTQAAASARDASAVVATAEADADATRNALIAMFGGLVFVSGLAFGVANFRRRKVRGEALSRLKEVETGLNAKLEKLIECMKDAQTYIGKTPEEARAQFQDRTLKLAKEVIDDVGTLFVMHGAANEMREQAAALAQPSAFTAKLWNLVAKGNFTAANALLKDRPIAFSPDNGLTVVMKGDLGSQSWKDALMADIKAFKPFEMTFDALMAEFDRRATRAATSFDTIRGALSTAERQIAEITQEAEPLKAIVLDLARRNADDGLFTLPAIEQSVLPAAEALLNNARTQRTRDPVGALEGAGAKANRLLDDAAELANLCLAARDQTMPRLEKARLALGNGGVNTEWLTAGTKAISSSATAVSQSIVGDSAHADIVKLAAKLEAHAARAELAASLEGRRSGPVAKSLVDVAASIDKARAELGAAVNVPAEKMLREADLDPSQRLDAGKAHHTQSKSSLDVGDVQGASTALDAASASVSEANGLIAQAREAVGSHAASVERLGSDIATARTDLGRKGQQVAQLQRDYSAKVLRSLAGFEQNVQTALRDAEGKIASAQKQHAAGQVITASRTLAAAATAIATANQHLASVTTLAQQLERLDRENAAKVANASSTLRSAKTEGADKRTRSVAAEAVSDALTAFDAAARTVGGNGRDPEATSTQLAAALEGVVEARRAVAADHQAHDNAASAIQSAEREVRDAGSYSDDGYSASNYGDCGVSSLNKAKRAFANRDYEGAERAAVSAKETAESNMGAATSDADTARENARQLALQIAAAAELERQRNAPPPTTYTTTSRDDDDNRSSGASQAADPDPPAAAPDNDVTQESF